MATKVKPMAVFTERDIARVQADNSIIFNGVRYYIDDRFVAPNDLVLVFHVRGDFKSVRSVDLTPLPHKKMGVA